MQLCRALGLSDSRITIVVYRTPRNTAFLDTSVTIDAEGLLTTNVYRKPTQSDQYLDHNSYHPHSVLLCV